MQIPNHIEELKSYHPGRSIEEICAELKIARPAILWNNENNRGVSSKVEQRIAKEIQSANLYPDPLSQELREKLALKVGCDLKNIVVENGSEALLYRINQAFLEPGEEILTSEGTFVAVYIWAKAANRVLRTVPLKEDFSYDLEAMLEAISDKTKVIYLANPNNPTGTSIHIGDLLSFIERVPKDIIVVVDEAYFEYARGMNPNFPDSTKWKRENVITLRTFSKAYGIAGVRVGYGIGDERLIGALNKVRMTFSPSGLAQAAALGALEDENYVVETVRLNAKVIKSFEDLLDRHEISRSRSTANFVMFDLITSERAAKFVEEMMRRGVFVRRLTAFGLPSCIRVSTGLPFENEMFINAFPEVMKKI